MNLNTEVNIKNLNYISYMEENENEENKRHYERDRATIKENYIQK